MKEKSIFIIKAIILTFFLIISYIVITYCVEQLELISISPLTISDARESHIRNILAPLPFIIIWGGWLYFLAFYAHHYLIKNKFADATFLVELGVGITVAMCFFLARWIFIEIMDFEVLLEGLIVYPLLGIILALGYMVLFRD